MNSLKPCPFCGSGANIEFQERDTGFLENFPRYSFWVECTECHSATAKFYDDSTEAIETWNKRVEIVEKSQEKPDKDNLTLLPCPFCGSAVHWDDAEGIIHDTVLFNCIIDMVWPMESNRHIPKEEWIRRWNTRNGTSKMATPHLGRMTIVDDWKA